MKSATSRLGLVGLIFVWSARVATAGDFVALKPSAFSHYINHFNLAYPGTVTNYVSDAKAREWLVRNVPLFECPDRWVEEVYYYRWWVFRKHIVATPGGFVVTEFLAPVNHAGPFNTLSCAAGLHLAEGRWLRDPRYLDDYTRFWLRGRNGRPQPHFHQFSGWLTAAAYDRYLVNGNRAFLVNLLNVFVSDYRAWEKERRLPNSLFWQYDVADGMEESISGSRTNRNIRPTINSYMYANAHALAAIARLANKPRLAREFDTKAANLRQLTQKDLWDPDAKFFKVRLENGSLSSAREAIGFIPWMFSLPDSGKGFEVAWRELSAPAGFRAPFGITTAERRHPAFRSHGISHCEWDGAVWPFATSQTLCALANVLYDYPQGAVTARDYFDAFLTFANSQRAAGEPYIGEYLDETTGGWIDRNARSAHYNHSTFADLVITGVVGLRPRADDTVEIYPLLPPGTWDWFCLDGVKYHGRMLTVMWDKDGSRYHRGRGFSVLADGKELARAETLTRLTGKLGSAKP